MRTRQKRRSEEELIIEERGLKKSRKKIGG